MKMNLRAFVAETMVPVINNVAEMEGTSQAGEILDLSLGLCECWNAVIPSKLGWQPSRMPAMEALYDKEVGEDKLHLPDPATEENIFLFDEQQKPTWITFARKLSKGHLHYVLREAARYELLGPVIMQRYSDEEMPSTEQAQLLSYISCKNTDSGIELHRNPLLNSILQDSWSALQKTASVLLEEARTKASADECGIMDALGTVFKEHFISTLIVSVTTKDDAKHFRQTHWKVWISLLHSSSTLHTPRRRVAKVCDCLACAYLALKKRVNLRMKLQVTQTGHYG